MIGEHRIGLTAEGRLLLCLGQEHSLDLRHVMRANPGDDAALEQALIDSMEIKPQITFMPEIYRVIYSALILGAMTTKSGL